MRRDQGYTIDRQRKIFLTEQDIHIGTGHKADIPFISKQWWNVYCQSCPESFSGEKLHRIVLDLKHHYEEKHL